ncbi:hypothetical protein C8F01DRAFT_1184240 [Mycena amicta]|nr:hypothetical protein C8F01DRAFT_1184240 [Mycena amicta]
MPPSRTLGLSSPPVVPLLIWSLLAWLTLVSGDLASSSSSWRKPTMSTTQAERVAIAQAALDKGVSMLDGTGQFSGESWKVAANLYYQLADVDMATGQTKYRETLSGLFAKTEQADKNFTDIFTWGHAAARAYQAYGDAEFLDYAAESWWYGHTYTLSAADISAGKIGSKSFAVAKTCSGTSMVGGTFWNNGADDQNIRSATTGQWFTTSALLAEATSDPLYLTAATDALNFFKLHFINASNNQVLNGIDGKTCALDTPVTPYNTGYLIEGLAVMYSIKKDAGIQSLLDDIVTAAIPNPTWQGSDGIIANGDDKTGDLNLAMGLAAAYARNATSPAIREYIREYLAVQFNAVVDLSTADNSNLYGLWTGPPASTFSASNQITAGAVLVGALSTTPDVSSSSSTTSSLGSSSTPTGTATSTAAASSGATQSVVAASAAGRSKSNKAPVIGGAIGGVLIFLLAVAGGILLCVCMRKRRREQEQFAGLPPSPAPAALDGSGSGSGNGSRSVTVDPFILPTERSDSAHPTAATYGSSSAPSPPTTSASTGSLSPNRRGFAHTPTPMAMVDSAGPATMTMGSNSKRLGDSPAAVPVQRAPSVSAQSAYTDSMPPPEYSTAI